MRSPPPIRCTPPIVMVSSARSPAISSSAAARFTASGLPGAYVRTVSFCGAGGWVIASILRSCHAARSAARARLQLGEVVRDLLRGVPGEFVALRVVHPFLGGLGPEIGRDDRLGGQRHR